MVSSRQTKSDLKSWVVALLCIAGIGVGGYFLYQDFNQSAGEGMGPVMAKIERREAKVRRKPSKSFAWSNAQQEEKLFRKDSVQTSAGSGAAIRFNDGTLLELGENSLVVIDDIPNLALDFLKGTVVLHTSQGDRRVTYGKDGKAKFEELPIRLLKPDPLTQFFTPAEEARDIHFAWQPREGQETALASNLSLQICTDRSFRAAKTRDLPIQDPHVMTRDLSLPAGTYFWRLSDSTHSLTEMGQFRIVGAKPLQPLSPGGDEKVISYGDGEVTAFKWSNGDALGETASSQGSHILEVARDSQFSSSVAHQEIVESIGSVAVSGLPEGAFYWRVRSRYGELSVTSRVERFAVTRAQRPAVALVFPEDKKTLERLAGLRLSWSSDAQGLDYAVEIKDSQGRSIGGGKTRATSFVFKNPEVGAYQWRIGAFSKGRDVGQTSWRAFSVFEGAPVVLKAPAQAQGLYTWGKPINFEFAWERDELLARKPGYSYQVVVSRQADFKDASMGPKTRDTEMPSEKLSLGQGDYFWRVQIVDPNGQTVKASDVRHFGYGLFPLLSAPEGLGPPEHAVFNLVEQEKDPVASWREQKDADAYEVALYAVDGGRGTASADGVPLGGRELLRTVTSKTQLEFKGLKPADYVWTVRAIDRLKRKGQPMATRPFSVTYGAVLSAPKVISPEVQ